MDYLDIFKRLLNALKHKDFLYLNLMNGIRIKKDHIFQKNLKSPLITYYQKIFLEGQFFVCGR